ncbi:alcohol acetyltransferase [Salicibibacter cibarius]|uniref:Alcohol acetyltransferase n=1 Tax=Salicibibacter cibarius TaxID=2743000 RepID=A0A7T6Z443_9BACI|nr:alcohol acetyltransferase [Salicibibacter cibarius]QQK76495.1 alcohol acetyltransferase [Salicibibacter cibarius]
MDQWYKIDNAGKIFHAVSESANSSVFRIAMIMTAPVEADKLQSALDDVMKRLPMFAVKLGKGVFWDFLVENDKKLFVQKEHHFPCAPIDPIETNGFLFRVIYYEKRIAVEFFHSVTDGTGGLEFLKALVYHYLLEQHARLENDGSILDIEDQPSTYELDDSYYNYKSDHAVKNPREGHAFQVKGTPTDETMVVHGVMKSSDIRTAAKAHGITMTAYITSVLIAAIYHEKLLYRSRKEEIKIAIPVNLRKMFTSKSLRNFFAVVNVGMQVEEQTTLEDIIEEVSKQLQKKAEKETLQHGLNHHVKLQTMLAARFVPNFIKYYAIRYGYKNYGERTKTMTLTNLGNVQLPEQMMPHIERMEMVMYPTKKSPVNGGICSINDQFVISFARSIEEADVIRSFFRELTKASGIDIEVYANDGG